MPRRPRILGFGPVGFALLLPLAALIWVAATGYDLQYQLLQLIDALFGWRGVFFYVSRIQVGLWFGLNEPDFTPISLCLALLVLHFAPRSPPLWAYAPVVLWSTLAPSLPWMFIGPSTPPWLRGGASTLLPLEFAAAVLTALPFAAATRSWRTALAVAALGGAATWVHDLLIAASFAGNVPATSAARSMPYLYNVGLAAIFTLWVIAQWRAIKPPHACPACAYDLRGITTVLCPECGAATPTQLRSKATAPPPAAATV